MNRPVYYTKVRVNNWEGGEASVMLQRHVMDRPPVNLGGRVGIVLELTPATQWLLLAQSVRLGGRAQARVVMSVPCTPVRACHRCTLDAAVLCDVPCSGDGTLRKDICVWSHWTPALAFQRHTVQRRILMRAMHLVAVGVFLPPLI